MGKVAPSSVQRWAKTGALRAAVVGRQLDYDHPAVQDFLRRCADRNAGPDPTAPIYGTRGRPSKLEEWERDRKRAEDPTEFEADPFAAAAALIRTKPIAATIATEEPPLVAAIAQGLPPEKLRELPGGLGAQSLAWVAENYGSFAPLNGAVEALRRWADYENKSTMAARRRGELVSRDVMATSVFGVLAALTERLTAEHPAACVEQVIARSLAGGEDVRIEVEEILHDSVSRFIRGVKEEIAQALTDAEAPDSRMEPKNT